MHIHYLKHVPFEGLGSMEHVFVAEGHRLSNTCLYHDQPMPLVHDIDALVIMGGPMGVHDVDRYPWLAQEKEFIEAALRRQIPVLGVCLGAQLLAEVLGASVSKNAHEEIGWYPVQCTREPGSCAQGFPESFEALHWHGDTFSIPAGASHFISSEGCENQAFVYENHAIALQFHLEMLPSHVQAIYQACGDPGKSGPYIQGLEDMLADCERFRQAQKILKDFLMAFISRKMTL
ncbi:MAG: type 1 glutamine amidotransferase [Gammaproteobacteria bacterium]|nr:type 1 glutamine amidotransferase [Gammaproteobacteria bacterium]